MALTRQFLLDLGLEKDVMQKILDEHGETVKSTKLAAKEEAEEPLNKKIKTLEGEKTALEKQVKKAPNDDWQSKYDTLKGEFDTYKTDTENAQTTAAKRAAVRQALKALGAHDEDLDTFLLDKADYDKVSDPKYLESFKEQYKRYFGETIVQGAGVATPPKGEGGNNYVAQLEAARKANDTAAAVKIKTEAAKENIFLI